MTTTTAAARLGIQVLTRGEAPGARPVDTWIININGTLTDEQAQEITFHAIPEHVQLGAFVEVNDHDGKRIGHIAGATYHERIAGPAYVVASIRLR